MQRLRHITFAAGILLSLGGFASAQDLTIATRSGPESLDPHFSAGRSSVETARHIFDTVIATDSNLQLVPALAVSWTPIEDTVWEIKLREGVKFHDGSIMMADDVAFSLARPYKVTGPSSTLIYVQRIETVEVIDPLTLHIHTKGPAPTLPNDLTRAFVVSKAAAGAYDTPETASEAFSKGKAAIGTGPYKLVSWEPKGALVLDLFDDYWRGKGDWTHVVRMEIPNDTSRLAALKAGQVDLITEVSSADYMTLQRDSAIQTIVGDSVYMANLALDQDMPTGFFGYNPNFGNPPYDPKAAKQLLAEAGYPDGFTLDIYCTGDGLSGDAAICQGLGQMFSAIGIDSQVNVVTRTVFSSAQARGDYTASLQFWCTLSGEAGYTLSSLLHSKEPEKGLGAWNRTNSSDPKLDRLTEEGMVELDAEKRRALYEEAMGRMRVDRYMLPIVQLQTVWAAKAGKLDYTPRIDQETLAFDVKAQK